jgi:hypothetical protein
MIARTMEMMKDRISSGHTNRVYLSVYSGNTILVQLNAFSQLFTCRRPTSLFCVKYRSQSNVPIARNKRVALDIHIHTARSKELSILPPLVAA